jgi:hypothetical protein
VRAMQLLLAGLLHCSACPAKIGPSLLPIVVRRGPDALLIEVRTKDKKGRHAPKTLQRPVSEALERSLARVGKAFYGKKAASDPLSLVDGYGAELDPAMNALDAWMGAAKLCIGSHTQLNVLVEPAEVTSLVLPSVPFVGIPLAPAIETLDCDARQCHWTWERLAPGSKADEWEQVGFEREYCPSDDDVSSRLRVRARPPAASSDEAALSFLACVAEAAAAVEYAPPRRLLARRVRAMPRLRAGGGCRVLSYNLLADCYSRNWDAAGSVHAYCSPHLTLASRRMPRLLEEVLAFSPDVVLLQVILPTLTLTLPTPS